MYYPVTFSNWLFKLESSMTKNNSATLIVGTPAAKLCFEWAEYDGDDCFDRYLVQYLESDDIIEQFQFGPCSTHSIRKIESFLKGETDTVESGFRIPQIIYCDLNRVGDSFNFHAYSTELSLDKRVEVKFEIIEFKKSFRKFYDQK